MKRLKTIYRLNAVFLFCILLTNSQNSIERSGVVVDKETNEPIEGVEIDIYMKTQKRDSLKQEVLTDKKGRFRINEKRDEDLMFQLRKAGYIGFVNSLEIEGDSVRMEKE
ncbi:MAG: hypothetical protein ACPGLV_12480 [Bacteroidia bacterium]